MVHDMAFTEKYALLLRPAGDVRPRRRDDRSCRCPTRGTTSTAPASGCSRVHGAVDDGSDVQWFDIDPCYVYHPLNAYDLDDGQRRARRGAAPEDVRDGSITGRTKEPTRFERWTIDPAEGKVVEETLERPLAGVPAAERGATRAGATGTATASGPRSSSTTSTQRRRSSTTSSRARPSSTTTAPGAMTLEPVFVPRDGCDRRGRRLGDVVRPRRDDGPRRRRDPRRAGLHRRPRRHRSTSRPASRSASTATGSPPRSPSCLVSA